MVSRTYSQEALAAATGVPRRTLAYWINQGLIPPAHGSSRGRGGRNRWAYYSDLHVRAVRAYRAVRDRATRQRDLAAFLAEDGITITDYADQFGIRY